MTLINVDYQYEETTSFNDHQHALVSINSEGSLYERLRNRQDMAVTAPPSDDELYAEQMRMQQNLFADFFGSAFSSVEAAQEAIENVGEEAIQSTQSLVIKELDELKETTIEQIIERQKKSEGEEFQRVAQMRSGVTVTENPKNGQRPETKPLETWQNRQASQARTTTQSSGYTQQRSGTSTTTTSNSSQAQARKEGEIPSAMDNFQRMNDSVQRMGMQRSKAWNQPAPKEAGDNYIHYAKWHQKLKYKTKKFFKSGKGRITTKVAALILLQLGMGVVGKRYQFENAGQMAVMFTMMVGSFFLTRELAEDGFDPTGLAF